MINITRPFEAENPRHFAPAWLWSPYGIGQTIIFCLWFLLSFFFLFFVAYLSGRRLDVCHTSTHGVALVQISDAGLKHAARGSLKIQDAKKSPKSPSGHHRTTISSQLRHVSTIGEKLVKQRYLIRMFPQYGELLPTSGWDRSSSLGHPS